jgi:hypothetical protein
MSTIKKSQRFADTSAGFRAKNPPLWELAISKPSRATFFTARLNSGYPEILENRRIVNMDHIPP